MILAGSAIREAMERGEIVISPFNPKNMGPNSYDVTLSPTLKVYDVNGCLDVRNPTPTMERIIPDSGLVLVPGILYLGATNEVAVSWKYAPMYDGRSSMGRIGLKSHITAGWGDRFFGFSLGPNGERICHNPVWVLEIEVTHPVRVYPNLRIGQVSFHEVRVAENADPNEDNYVGKYSRQTGPQESLSWQDAH